MSEWIDVKDNRKPPLQAGEDSISIPVLLHVTKMQSHVVIGRYLHHSRAFRPDGSMGFEKYVTHWQPLPEPPANLQDTAEPVKHDG